MKIIKTEVFFLPITWKNQKLNNTLLARLQTNKHFNSVCGMKNGTTAVGNLATFNKTTHAFTVSFSNPTYRKRFEIYISNNMKKMYVQIFCNIICGGNLLKLIAHT